MSRIHTNSFLGIVPKLSKTLLANNQAQTAKDCALWSGALRPLAGLALPATLAKPTGEIKTIWSYNNNSDWLCWSQDVDVVRTPVAGDTLEKIYFTGTDKPRVTTKDLYDDGTPGTSLPPASYVLGIPRPDTAPVASDTGAGNIEAGNYAWVFTFVRKWSDGTADEGPPSLPSNILTLAASRQASITLPNGGMTTPTDYGISHKRLYRSSGGAYFFVSEVTIGTSPTADNVATPNLGTELLTTFFEPPPDGLIGIIELANGVVAGFKGNVVYLSEPYRPWAFPPLNQYAIPWEIVGLGSFGTSVIVATKGYAYIGRGIDPAAYFFQSDRSSYYPCAAKRSIATGVQGVFWAAPNGIVLASESGVQLVSKAFIEHREWDAFKPSTMHAEVHEGRYYAWFHEDSGVDQYGNKNGGGLILDLTEPSFLTTLGSYVQAAYSRPDTGQLWVSRKGSNMLNQVFAFDADPADPLTHEWKSKMFLAEGLDNFGFAQVIADFGAGLTQAEIDELLAQIASIIAFNASITETDGSLNETELNFVSLNGDSMLLDVPSAAYTAAGVTFRYWADEILRYQKTITSNEPFPLPSGFRAERHEFAVSGDVEVQQVTLASSREELASI